VEANGAMDEAGKQQAGSQLAKRVKDVVGISAEVNVRDTGAVARSEGKAVRLVDNRQKD